jgi:hypothetical protein
LINCVTASAVNRVLVQGGKGSPVAPISVHSKKKMPDTLSMIFF